MTKRVLYSLLTVALGVNLFIGAQIYFYSSAYAAGKDDPYPSYRLLSDVMEKVRREYVDSENLTYEELIHGALRGMLSSLDPHSEFLDERKYKELRDDTQGEFGGVGIVISMTGENFITVVSPMEDTPGFRAGILSGDRIVKIDGHSTEKYTLQDAVKRLRGKPGTDVSLTTFRPSSGQVQELVLTRAVIKVDTVKDIDGKSEFPLGGGRIGYIRLSQFGERTASDLDDALKKLRDQGMRALILDLRNNPGGLLDQAVEVSGRFLPRGQLVVSTEGDNSRRSHYTSNGRGRQQAIPTVILVNRGSASASEIVAGCLQDLQHISQAIVVGEQTFGKGSVQSILPLEGGRALRLTTAKYYTPSHKVIHEKGITPDIVVSMSEQEEIDLFRQRIPGALDNLDEEERQRISNARDPQLDRATDVLRGILLYAQRTDADARVARK